MNPSDESYDDEKTVAWVPTSVQAHRTEIESDRYGLASDDEHTTFHPSTERGGVQGQDDGKTMFHPPEGSQNPALDESTVFRGSVVFESQETVTARKPVRLPAVQDVILGGHYKLIEELASGAQAFAFKAHDQVRDSVVFVKISRNVDFSESAYSREIALRDHLYKLEHRNLLRCQNMEISGGRLVEVYDFHKGVPFSQWLASKASLDRDEIRSVVLQLSEGIQALQNVGGLVHRDIKPDNILVLPTAEPFLLKIVDYGTACRIAAGGLTHVEGSRFYSPPECLMRHSANDQSLRSWDWWSLGRVVQQLVDGIDIVHRMNLVRDRLPKNVVQSEASQEMSNRHLLDVILFEREVNKYHVRAGMVELSGEASATWLPLMRGLLTTTKDDRWGYEQVKLFMAGHAVRDRYDVPAGAEKFAFDGTFLELSELARRLINGSAKLGGDFLVPEALGRGKKDLWEQAKDLVRGGPITRYITDVLRNVDLDRELVPLLRIPDRDLGTALVLLRLAEVDQVPAVRDRFLDRNLALELAERDSIRAKEMFKNLLEPSYIALQGRLHRESAAELMAAHQDISKLRELLTQLDVRSMSAPTRFSDQSLLLTVSKGIDLSSVAALEDFRAKLGRTDNAPLHALFSKTPDSLSALERSALLLALTEPATNRFVSKEAIAGELARRGNNLRTAATLNDAAAMLSSRTLFTMGDIWVRILAAALMELLILYVASVPYQMWPVFVFIPVAFGFSKLAVLRGVRRDVGVLDPDVAAVKNWTAKTLTDRAGQWTAPLPNDSKRVVRELNQVNASLKELSGVDTSRFEVKRPSLRRARGAKLLQIGLGGLFMVATAAGNVIVRIEAHDQAQLFKATHPKPFAVQAGRQVYRAADLAPRTQEKYFWMYKVLQLEGSNILIVGDLDRARLAAPRSNLVVQGNVRASEIILHDGTITAGSVSESGITIKGDGTVTLKDVSHSTINAKRIVVQNSKGSNLFGETVKVQGIGKSDAVMHPWHPMP